MDYPSFKLVIVGDGGTGSSPVPDLFDLPLTFLFSFFALSAEMSLTELKCELNLEQNRYFYFYFEKCLLSLIGRQI